MKVRLLALLLLAALQSCMYDSAETLVDNQIDAKLRQTIKVKNDSMLQAMKYSDYKALKQLGSPDFVKFMHAKLKKDNLIWAFRNGFLEPGNCTVYHEYYNKHEKAPNNTVITDEKDGYTFSFTNREEETYICMLKATFNNMDNYLVTLMYGMIDGQWKLNDIEVGGYGIYDKNATEYLALAEKATDDDYIIDALMYYDIADDLLQPCGNLLKYDNADRINQYARHMRNKYHAQYHFPQKLNSMITTPEIVSIAPVKNAKGFYPLINYKTMLPLNDTISLKKEYEQVKAEAKKLYTGLNFNKSCIYYRAYNEASGDSYTFDDIRK